MFGENFFSDVVKSSGGHVDRCKEQALEGNSSSWTILVKVSLGKKRKVSWVQDGKKPDNINRKISFLDQEKPKLSVFSRLEYPKGNIFSRLEPSTSR